MAGERKVLGCLDLGARFPFAVEMKEAAVQFLNLNERDGSFDFVFKDVREFIEKNGVGSVHGQCGQCDAKPGIGEVLDLLIAGPPCPPFSFARAGRIKEGTQTHADADGFLQFFKALLQFEPSIAVAD
jgi:site-specific DNA-cytosine methylase